MPEQLTYRQLRILVSHICHAQRLKTILTFEDYRKEIVRLGFTDFYQSHLPPSVIEKYFCWLQSSYCYSMVYPEEYIEEDLMKCEGLDLLALEISKLEYKANRFSSI